MVGANRDSQADPQLAGWIDALRVAALIAVDPHGLGGVSLQAAHGPVREQWLAHLQTLLPPGTPMRRVPAHARDDRLLGGLDLAATLQAGRLVSQPGLLAQADGGLLVVAMAERLEASAAAHIGSALDSGRIALAREGLQESCAARVGVIALDEGLREPGQEERPPERLLERLALHLDLTPLSASTAQSWPPSQEAGLAVAQARERLAGVQVDDAILQALCEAALALGIDSMRAPILALRAARIAAALDGRTRVEAADAALAARLVLAPRATQLPAVKPEPDEEAPDQAPPPAPEASTDASPLPPPDDNASQQAPEPGAQKPRDEPLPEQVLEAARAAIPADLLARLLPGAATAAVRGGGRRGAEQEGRLRGRPAGVRAGMPRDGRRLALIDTLRAAAPWQTLRRRDRAVAAVARSGTAAESPPSQRMEIRAPDLRIARLRERRETTTVFAVDASGSAALHRLAETKGAVELLLAECYVRRDRVAVVAFRGRAAEVLLAPTRSLARARRSLAGLPGGGGTPLAAGIEAACDLADAVTRRGGHPVIVLLTDGRANVSRSGAGGRTQADAEARTVARRVRLARHASLLIDTSPQPQVQARGLAAEMGAAYLALPHADAQTLSRAVQDASRGGSLARPVLPAGTA
jgi:magnesium chelatase subunit D